MHTARPRKGPGVKTGLIPLLNRVDSGGRGRGAATQVPGPFAYEAKCARYLAFHSARSRELFTCGFEIPVRGSACPVWTISSNILPEVRPARGDLGMQGQQPPSCPLRRWTRSVLPHHTSRNSGLIGPLLCARRAPDELV